MGVISYISSLLISRLSKDVILHFTACLIISQVVASILAITLPYSNVVALSGGIGVSVGIGIYKEYIIDNYPSKEDLISDILGALVGVLILYIYQ